MIIHPFSKEYSFEEWVDFLSKGKIYLSKIAFLQEMCLKFEIYLKVHFCVSFLIKIVV